MKKLIYSCFTLLLFACGNKKVNDQKEVVKDSTNISNRNKVDSTSTSNTNTRVYDKPVVTDSNQVYTDTEVLNEKGQLDPNSSPQAVVQTIIRAAKTGKYGPLLKLSNPAVEMDGDAKDIINVPNKSKEDQKEFNDYFGNAKIIGKPRIKRNLAEVDIETTAEGGDKETIVCENKYERWYLKGM